MINNSKPHKCTYYTKRIKNNTDLRSLLGAELNILLALFQLKSPAPISNFGRPEKGLKLILEIACTSPDKKNYSAPDTPQQLRTIARGHVTRTTALNARRGGHRAERLPAGTYRDRLRHGPGLAKRRRAGTTRQGARAYTTITQPVHFSVLL